ncbi:MAG: adenylosuccinate synthetase, partial [Candidatus Dadabacteria bacterium]
GYRYKGETLTSFPSSCNILGECEPVYEEVPGWSEDISGVTEFEELPKEAKNYIRKIEELTGVGIYAVSLGPSREKILFLSELA